MSKLSPNELFMVIVFTVLLAITVLLLTGCDRQGPRGYTGSPGNSIVGPTGPQGPAGSSVSFTETPATASECPTGGVDITLDQSTGVSTTSICNGAIGATGATGAAGQNGTNATPITFVQFCSGFTPSYPNTFPEYGLCVNNVMYGVYSANGGFLAELPPGEYSSDGINASCTFTIGQNCQVSQ